MLQETSTYRLWTLQNGQELDLGIKVGEQPSKIAPGDALYSQNCLFANRDDKGVYHPIGSVVKDGNVYYDAKARPKNWAMFVIPKVGKPYITHIPPPIADRKLSFYGTPQILKGGKVDITSAKEGTAADITNGANIRSAIGIKADGTIGLLATKTKMTLRELAFLMISLGFVDAMNMDGGGSVATHKIGNSHVWQRPTSSALYVVGREATEKDRFRVVVCAGHGPETAGKRTPDGSMREFQFNQPVAELVTKMLNQCENVEVLQVHENSRDVPLKERTDRANVFNADVYISIHANASGDTWSNAQGIETYVYTTRPAPAVALANSIQRKLIRETGRPDRGVKSANFHVLRETKMAAVLVECGFMTNKQEAALLKSDEYRRKCANAIFEALVETYGLKQVSQPPGSLDPLPTIQRRIAVQVHGQTVGEGYLINNRTYVPILTVGNIFGAEVQGLGDRVNIKRELK